MKKDIYTKIILLLTIVLIVAVSMPVYAAGTTADDTKVSTQKINGEKNTETNVASAAAKTQTVKDMILQKTSAKVQSKSVVGETKWWILYDIEEKIREANEKANAPEILYNSEVSGDHIDIPAGLGTVYTVTCYGTPGWYMGGWVSIASGTMQETVHQWWVDAGSEYSEGLAVLNGRYLVATTTYFGNVGDFVTFTLASGEKLPCIIADAKNSSDSGWSIYGHKDGLNTVEFEVDPDVFYAYGNNPGTGGWASWLAGGVVAADKY